MGASRNLANLFKVCRSSGIASIGIATVKRWSIEIAAGKAISEQQHEA